MNLVFPKDFIWGTATSAYQIEGAVKLGGREESNWDIFCQKSGNILNQETGDIACDHYVKWQQDVALMSDLGIKAYRFSLAWPRIFPKGDGQVNSVGLEFYDHLINELLKHHIEPVVTLYHWDLPQKLQESGGWVSRKTAEAFAVYAVTCFERFKDRVKIWITHNEPWVVSMLGYRWGIHAPGMQDDLQSIIAAHHLLLSHGMALKEMKDCSQNFKGKIGIALNLNPVEPENPTNGVDPIAAKQHELILNTFFLDALYKGQYPQEVLDQYPLLSHTIQKDDMQLISMPNDFLGINYYSRSIVRGSYKEGKVEGRPLELPNPYSTMWEFYPQGLTEVIEYVWKGYHPHEIMITENGTALNDELTDSLEIVDDKRIEYIQAHVKAVHGLIEKSIPITGYFVWSLLDNFEWAYGYQKRFGLVYVDFSTLERTPKKSAKWFGNVSKSNAI